MENSSPPSRSADHLVVLVHGLWGNPSHMAYLSSAIREQYAEDQVHILVSKKNIGSYTYDGIEVGGERVANEVEVFLDDLDRKGQPIKKISVVGYSLGGVVARYAIGLLYHKGLFDKIEPVNFTTFATPHLGVRTPLRGLYGRVWNAIGSRTLSVSGKQLWTLDSFRDTGRPLLAVLADPDSIFIRALARFKYRSLYGNIVNDRTVVYYTGAISKTDPYELLDDVNINYCEGYAPVIVDPSNPVSRKFKGNEPPPFYQRFLKKSKGFAEVIPMTALFAFFMPIGLSVLFVGSAIQSIQSPKRIKMHLAGKAGADFGAYRIPLMIEDARRTAQDMFENMNHEQEQEYAAGAHSAPGHSDSDLSLAEKGTIDSDYSNLKEKSAQQMEFPTLALTADQFKMIDALDSVGFRKYPVHINKSHHSHAAIIVRKDWKAMEEGKVVARHWLSEFEV